jgi:PAS domain S-box-containing protein
VADDNRRPGPQAPGAQELFRLLVESATDVAMFSMDPDGLVTSWNIGAERVLGWTEQDIIGTSADVMFPPEDGGASAGEQERRIALERGRAEDERWQLRKDGSRFWASGVAIPLADPSLGFAKILRDRTEQHHAQMQLQENEERFRLLATHIPQLVFRSRPNGDRTWGSPQWIEFTGMGFDESLEHGWIDAVHPDDREATLAGWEEAQRTGHYFVEHRIRRSRDGVYRWHHTRALPVDRLDADWVGTSTDIHELRGFQDRQQVLLAELQHRTRNLLAVVQSIASQTLRKSESLEEFAGEFESRLRALSRVQSLLARADHQDIDLGELIKAELTAHGDGSVTPDKVRIEGQAVALPSTSAQALGLALHELATNAVKYGALAQPAGTLRIVTRVVQDETSLLVLDWTESGVSMPDGQPKRRGYGSELIERALPYQLGAKTKLEFKGDGVRCQIAVPLTKDGGAKHG